MGRIISTPPFDLKAPGVVSTLTQTADLSTLTPRSFTLLHNAAKAGVAKAGTHTLLAALAKRQGLEPPLHLQDRSWYSYAVVGGNYFTNPECEAVTQDMLALSNTRHAIYVANLPPPGRYQSNPTGDERSSVEPRSSYYDRGSHNLCLYGWQKETAALSKALSRLFGEVPSVAAARAALAEYVASKPIIEVTVTL